ncbi:hypothetical protein SSX86_023723 [Deinandra increscens subsp. villosa]|uniref:Protein kinase domain-containing protein n=1 Tax=Deinandra increscens subsp. villosa TaxID=3103831 RepID=A0AAP0CLF6_9ASTR
MSEPQKIPLKDIASVTNNFADENFIGEGFLGKIYKGRLPDPESGELIDVSVRRLDYSFWLQEMAFDKEISILSRLKHENMVSNVGFCYENNEMLIINKYVTHGSLRMHLSGPTLDWKRRLKISIGVVRALSYLHNDVGRKFSVIHHNINSNSILLDENWEAKISGFEYSMTIPAGHLDLAYEKLGIGTYKSDVFSIGIEQSTVAVERTVPHHLKLKENRKDILRISLEDILLATGNFSHEKYIRRDRCWETYRGIVSSRANEYTTSIEVDRLHCPGRRERVMVYEAELKVLMKYKHENVIALLGYCEEEGERIMVHEPALNGSLDRHLSDVSLTWGKRLKICIDIASGLDFLHGGLVTGEVVIHRDIRSRSILLDGDMNAKIARFGQSVMHPIDQDLQSQSIPDMIVAGKWSYVDPEYARTKVLSKECDIYSFGIVLFEIMLKRLAYSPDFRMKDGDLGPMMKRLYKEGKLDAMVFEGATEPIVPQSLTIFRRTAIQCLHENREDRPTAGEVLIQLKQALEIQILCGRMVYPTMHNSEPLCPLAKNYYEQNKINELVFEGIKEQIVPQSLSTFAKIAHKCLHDDWHQRPTATEVIAQLNEAKEFQVDCEMWEPKLPSDYKEIIKQSGTPEIRYTKKKKDLYDMLYEGILIQKGKVWFSLGSDNKRNEMISATIFTYKNQSLQKWRHNRKSRFHKVPLMMDISDLKIQAQIKAQFLTPSVIYGVYLVFKFAESDKISSKPKYVNLKYKLENETLHAYFATWRKDKWMMIELYRFLNNRDDSDFEVLLESFSLFYCKSGPIYIEGIEFRAIENETHEEIEKLKDVHQIMRSNSFTGHTQQFPADNYDEIPEFFDISDEHTKVTHEEIDKLQYVHQIMRSNSYTGHMQQFSGDNYEEVPEFFDISDDVFFDISDEHAKVTHEEIDKLQDVHQIMRSKSFTGHMQQFSGDNYEEVPEFFDISDDVFFDISDEHAKVTHEEIDKLQDVHQIMRSNSFTGHIQQFSTDNYDEVPEFFDISDDEFFDISDDEFFDISDDEFFDITDEHAKVTHEDIEKLKDVQQFMRTGSLTQISADYDQMNLKKHHILSAKEVLYDYPNVKLFKSKPSERTRFEEVIEVLSQQVFRIKCKIESRMLSPDTNYRCYLIYKLSEKCCGLHCPVKVRGPLYRSNKVIKTLYFRSPNAWNIHDINQVPRQREDEWMEVNVWNFNSKIYNRIHVNLKLISYEGTMSGLIIYGIEFRPM